MRRTIPLVAALFSAAFVTPCAAQTLSEPVMISTGSASHYSNMEPAIAISRTNANRIAVSWQIKGDATLAPDDVWWSLSEDGGLTFSARQRMPLPPELVPCLPFVRSFDPYMCASRDGTIFLGGGWVSVSGFSNTSPFVARLPSSSTTLETPARVVSECLVNTDFPRIAIGQAFDQTGSTAEDLYVPFLRQIPNTSWRTAQISRAIRGSQPLGTQWPAGQPLVYAGTQFDSWNEYSGEKNWAGVVTRANGLGRIVVVAGNGKCIDGGGNPNIPNSALRANYSNDGGETWVSDGVDARHLWKFGPTNDVRDIDYWAGCTCPAPAGDPCVFLPAGFFYNPSPWLTVDPTRPGHVYIVFAARAAFDPYPPGTTLDTKNVDLFFAWSSDAGATWPTNQIYRIDDSRLKSPDEPDGPIDQLQPGMAVDKFGGITIIFYRTGSPDNNDGTPNSPNDTVVTMRLAYFTGPAALHPVTGGVSFVADISTPHHLTPPQSQPYYGALTVGLGNDYPAIDAAGCTVVMAYPDRLPGSEAVNLFFRRLNLCKADVDGNADVNALDVGAFTAAFTAGTGQGDFDGNNTLNAADAAAFLVEYQRATGP